jgi:hypothetical protein
MDKLPDIFADAVRQQLTDDGYSVHQGGSNDGEDLAGRHWFCWSVPGMADAEAGPTCDSELEAWSMALAHRLANSSIPLRDCPDAAPMGPFHRAHLPEAALNVDLIAGRFGVSRDAAAQQVQSLRQQAVYMNDCYQVNVLRVPMPFGPACGDMAWLSIKRRDKAPIHDWRALQEIKNQIVGPEHEGFEVYPAESRLVDTANQYHLWIFLDPRVRLPVGFREREVMGADAAAAVGARQRDFASA